MSLWRFQRPSLGDKLREQAEFAEAKAEEGDKKALKGRKVIKKKSKKK